MLAHYVKPLYWSLVLVSSIVPVHELFDKRAQRMKLEQEKIGRINRKDILNFCTLSYM